MENSNKTENDQIKDFLLLMLKNWYYFVISFGIFGVIGIIYHKTATPVMNVSAVVSLRHDESLVGNPISASGASSLMSAFGLGGGNENIEDESIKMSSQGYIRKVVKNLELNKVYVQTQFLGLKATSLYDLSPVILIVDSFMADTLSKNIHFSLNIDEKKTEVKIKAGKDEIGKFEITSYPATLETSWGQFTLEKTAHYDLYEKPMKLKLTYTNYDYMAQIYRKKLLIDYEKKTSDLIDLDFSHENVAFAKKVLNEVINIYNQEWDSDKGVVSEKTLAFIDKRLILTETLLSDADAQIKQFKDKYNLTTIEADVAFYLKFTAELQAKLLEAETQLNVANVIVDFVQDEKNKYALVPFDLTLANANMTDAISKYNEALTKRNEAYKTNTQSALIRSLDVQISEQRNNLLTSFSNIKKELMIVRDNLKKKEREFDSKLGNIPTIEKDYVRLKREQELQQNIYVFLLEMREQMAVKGISLLPKLKVIDAPYVGIKQVSPRLMNVALFVFFFGMAIPISLIYGIPFLKKLRKIFKKDDQ